MMRKMMMEHLVFVIIAVIGPSFGVGHVDGVEVPRIRGIPISLSSLYTPNLDFECFDGSRKILFSKVNDDYCDCGDGSDEPGTAACSNGSFFCQNSGYKALRIPAGKVNDGVCDCCDGTDEYASGKPCIDICQALGKEASEEARKAAELSRAGNKIRTEMIGEGKKLRSENTERLKKLRSDYQEAELLKQEKEMIKNVVEEREKAALEKYKPQTPETPEIPNEGVDHEAQVTEVEEYFKMLDKDESGTVTMFEVQMHTTFDKDQNGVVTEEEAMYFLSHHDEVNFEEFRDKAWSNIKPFVMKEEGTFEQPSDTIEQPSDTIEQPTVEQPDLDETYEDDRGDDELAEADDEEDDSENENDDEQEYQDHPTTDDGELSKSKIEYDEETQLIVDEANTARTHFQQAEKAILDLQNEMRGLESKIERDYGPDDVFAALDGQCVQYTNFEYVYSMCMYGRATQSAKSGGSEVLLGHWQDWTGTENNKYSQMKFGGGSACWNGPARSSIVDLRCGLENKLVSVAEPRRCEYTMIFETPAVCNADIDVSEVHDEL